MSFGDGFDCQVTEDPMETGLNNKEVVSVITGSPEVGQVPGMVSSAILL